MRSAESMRREAGKGVKQTVGWGGSCHRDCDQGIPYTVGLLYESHRDSTELCCGLEQFGLCLQHTGRDMAGHSPF